MTAKKKTPVKKAAKPQESTLTLRLHGKECDLIEVLKKQTGKAAGSAALMVAGEKYIRLVKDHEQLQKDLRSALQNIVNCEQIIKSFQSVLQAIGKYKPVKLPASVQMEMDYDDDDFDDNDY